MDGLDVPLNFNQFSFAAKATCERCVGEGCELRLCCNSTANMSSSLNDVFSNSADSKLFCFVASKVLRFRHQTCAFHHNISSFGAYTFLLEQIIVEYICACVFLLDWSTSL